MAKSINFLELNEDDIELLSRSYPKSPCTKCSLSTNGACCGCDAGKEYSKWEKQYKDANLLDIMISISNLRKLAAQKQEIDEKISHLEKDIYEHTNLNKNTIEHIVREGGSILWL